MIDFKKYKHVIWDWNGTLLNDAWLCVDVMNGMLEERKLPTRTLEQYMEVFDFPVRAYYEKLGYDFTKEDFEVVGLEFMVRYNKRQRESTLHEGAVQILNLFSEMGFRQYILSAREQVELIEETRKLNVYQYFTRIYGLQNHYAHGKTDVGYLLIEEIAAPLETILFIGDTRHDAEVARELGIDCVLISNGHHTRERLKRMNFPIVSSINEVINSL